MSGCWFNDSKSMEHLSVLFFQQSSHCLSTLFKWWVAHGHRDKHRIRWDDVRRGKHHPRSLVHLYETDFLWLQVGRGTAREVWTIPCHPESQLISLMTPMAKAPRGVIPLQPFDF